MNDLNRSEAILEPNLPIVDAHHHLWLIPEGVSQELDAHGSVTERAVGRLFRRYPRYLFDELVCDLTSGHNVRATVYAETHAMYRSRGPDDIKSVGEVEFVNGIAAMGASGAFGGIQTCVGIVGGVDLRLGARVEDVLQAHILAGGGRYRGVRAPVVYDDDSTLFGTFAVASPHVLLDPQFREGFGCLNRLGLSFDAFVLEPQLPELLSLARAFPETKIVLNHVGAPVGTGRYAGKRAERYPLWRENMRSLAKCENVAVKLGGLGNPFGGFHSLTSPHPLHSKQLADEWRPYIEPCIEAFGSDRGMFESNFPVDSAVCSYATIWNVFKRLTSGASELEKLNLFGRAAERFYHLAL